MALDDEFDLCLRLAPLFTALFPAPTRAVGVAAVLLFSAPPALIRGGVLALSTPPALDRGGDRAGVRGAAFPTFAADGVRALGRLVAAVEGVRAGVRTGVRDGVRAGVRAVPGVRGPVWLCVRAEGVLGVRPRVGVGAWACTSASFAFSCASLSVGVAWAGRAGAGEGKGAGRGSE